MSEGEWYDSTGYRLGERGRIEPLEYTWSRGNGRVCVYYAAGLGEWYCATFLGGCGIGDQAIPESCRSVAERQEFAVKHAMAKLKLWIDILSTALPPVPKPGEPDPRQEPLL